MAWWPGRDSDPHSLRGRVFRACATCPELRRIAQKGPQKDLTKAHYETITLGGVNHSGGTGEPWTGVRCYMGWLQCLPANMSPD